MGYKKRGPLNKLDVTEFVLNSFGSLKSLTKHHLGHATHYFSQVTEFV